MTDAVAATLFAFLLTCFTAYLSFRGIAWALTNGWRSMFGLVALRGEAVLEWQDRDVKDGTDWDVHVDTALDILLTHEVVADVDEFGRPERWIALEEEFSDLDPLAAKLAERAQ